VKRGCRGWRWIDFTFGKWRVWHLFQVESGGRSDDRVGRKIEQGLSCSRYARISGSQPMCVFVSKSWTGSCSRVICWMVATSRRRHLFCPSSTMNDMQLNVGALRKAQSEHMHSLHDIDRKGYLKKMPPPSYAPVKPALSSTPLPRPPTSPDRIPSGVLSLPH
jgi:hypothetical protein